MKLEGRTAVITGAASGIGLALTERLVHEGMAVVMADIETGALQAKASGLRAEGARIEAVPCDVSDPSQVEALKDAALAAFSQVHLVCNNAGVGLSRPTYKTSPEAWQWVIGVNLLGVAYGISTFVPLLVEQGEGHVVNTASEAGLCASPFLGSYHPSKYGVVGLSEALAMELEGTGVGVSCLCPELVNTRVFEATRNAPAGLGLPPPPPVDISTIEAMMQSVAMDPKDVAADVAYAVRAGRFWILTHQSTLGRVVQRNRELETGGRPKPGRRDR